jgi:hypothetical protein
VGAAFAAVAVVDVVVGSKPERHLVDLKMEMRVVEAEDVALGLAEVVLRPPTVRFAGAHWMRRSISVLGTEVLASSDAVHLPPRVALVQVRLAAWGQLRWGVAYGGGADEAGEEGLDEHDWASEV